MEMLLTWVKGTKILFWRVKVTAIVTLHEFLYFFNVEFFRSSSNLTEVPL